MAATERAQSEIIGTILLSGIVILSLTVLGTAMLMSQAAEVEQFDRAAEYETTLDRTSLSITHRGGADRPLSELELIVRQDGDETRYDLSDPGVRLDADVDGDGTFEGGESITVSHSYTGEVRILLLHTASGTLLYDETKSVPGVETSRSPTIAQFDVTDTSADGDASFDVTWNATDEQGDIVRVDVELINDGTSEDTNTTNFNDASTTGVNTDTLTNASGGGEVYTIELTVTDAAGNTATATVVDVADSDIGIRPPTIDTFEITDQSTGSEAAYDYTYDASDPDGDIVRVTVELFKESTGVRIDNVTDTYAEVGSTGVQTGRLTDLAGSQNDGETYRIDVTVTDLEGNDVRASTTDVADGGGGGDGTGAPPSIGEFNVTDTSSGGDLSFDVTWDATDVDGDIESATLELERVNGNQVLDSVPYTSGEFTSGSDTGTQTGNLTGATQGNNKDYIVRLTVTDSEGKTDVREETYTK